ncbi:hypothetical protein ASD06_09910 [Angustibacter sp. Root456]|nr:hypothetical protein ASD06_09910 [Angustibacter sp. Root456]
MSARTAVALLVVALAALVAAPQAQAAAYRYWGYFQLTNGTWAFAQKGPDQTVPKDGSVEGWRFAVADQSSTRTPRVTPTFDQLCSGKTTANGQKLVGLVVDFGRPADSSDGSTPPAPRGECVSVPQDATGSAVLAAAGLTLRVDKGLMCGIQNWPASGCGDPVAEVPAAAKSPDTSITLPAKASAANDAPDEDAPDEDAGGGGLPTAAWIGIAAVVVIAAGLGLMARRRSAGLDD